MGAKFTSDAGFEQLKMQLGSKRGKLSRDNAAPKDSSDRMHRLDLMEANSKAIIRLKIGNAVGIQGRPIDQDS
jgi:hypothetical protein